jgi:hypothetical protein
MIEQNLREERMLLEQIEDGYTGDVGSNGGAIVQAEWGIRKSPDPWRWYRSQK